MCNGVKFDALQTLETINLELILADLEPSVEKRYTSSSLKLLRTKDKEALIEAAT